MNKDWSGNKKSTFTTLGSSSHSNHEREKHDYYATEPRVINELLVVEDFDECIWEPACGSGHLSIELEKAGKQVLSTDLIYRGYGTGGVDFLKEDWGKKGGWPGDIITNPPYKYAQQFVEHALKLIEQSTQADQKIAFFLKLTFLEGKKRQKLFAKYPPHTVYVYSSRRKCALNGDFISTGSSAAAYAWFVWRKGFVGDTVIKWID